MTASIDLLRARLEEERPQLGDLDPEGVLLALVEVTGRLATSLSHRDFGGPDAPLGQDRALTVAVFGLWLHDLLAPVECEIVADEDVPADVTSAVGDVKQADPDAQETVDHQMFPPPPKRQWAESPAEQPTNDDDEAWWSGARWREVLHRHDVRVVDAVRKAQDIADGLADRPKAPANLNEIRHPGLAAHLRVWVESHGVKEAG